MVPIVLSARSFYIFGYARVDVYYVHSFYAISCTHFALNKVAICVRVPGETAEGSIN